MELLKELGRRLFGGFFAKKKAEPSASQSRPTSPTPSHSSRPRYQDRSRPSRRGGPGHRSDSSHRSSAQGNRRGGNHPQRRRSGSPRPENSSVSPRAPQGQENRNRRPSHPRPQSPQSRNRSFESNSRASQRGGSDRNSRPHSQSRPHNKPMTPRRDSQGISKPFSKPQTAASSHHPRMSPHVPSRPAPAPTPAQISRVQEELVGVVTHFFSGANAAAIKISASQICVGDEIRFRGASTDFKMKIESMQINRVAVSAAAKGGEIGILVKDKVREGDEVYRIR